MKTLKSTFLATSILLLFSIINPFQATAQTDIGIVSILLPVDSTVYGSQVSTKIVLKNFGQTTVSTTECLLYIDTVLYFSEIFSLSTPLAPDSSVELTFSNTYLAPKKDYILKIENSTAPDTSIANNTLTKQIYNKTAAIDIAVFNLVITPSNGDTTCMNVNLTVSYDYTNTGTDTIFGDTIRYDINSAIISVEFWTGILAPGDTNTFTFATTFMSPLGPYYLDVLSYLAGDAFPADNELALYLFGVNCNPSFNDISNKLKQITIYPNPAKSQLNLEIEELTSEESVTLSVFNSLGQEIESSDISKGMKIISINIEGYPKGIYFIRLQNKEQVIAVGKFVKE